ncbi:MAG TPA: hypothetical protein VNY05_41200 [Candidatus Acidoferrales bacterium]|jgi:hypothetical protein|nr:hypothetical protein [Candidatus Acidoferrales bacterium]
MPFFVQRGLPLFQIREYDGADVLPTCLRPLVSRISDTQFERSGSQELGIEFMDDFLDVQVHRRVALLPGIVKAWVEDSVSIFVKQGNLAEVGGLCKLGVPPPH